ncbi:MAG: MlaD family protein [Proteobacteria bacterium]|nr:MlaD family protein [Pseudomonadota bacterium]
MSNKANPVLIGGFIVGALALVIVAVLLFVNGVFSNPQKNMIFFEGSVNGLNIGALVKLKGVPVGKVTDILVIYDDQRGKIITPVIIEFTPQKLYDLQGGHIEKATNEDIKLLINKGMRAQLQTQSLVTGQLFIDINFRPETPIKMLGGDHPLYPEIPSIPSSKEQLENTIEEIVAMVRKMPIQQTVESLSNSIQQVEKLLKSPEIASSLATLDHTLKDVRHLVQNVDGKIAPLVNELQGSAKESRLLLESINKNAGPVMQSAQEAMKATTGTMDQARSTLLTIDQVAAQNASLDLALKDLASAAKSLRVLADYLERHPDALIYGKNPKGE